MRSIHSLSASYMYSSTTPDPENVLASGRVFLEDSPGTGCLGLGAPCRSTSTRSLFFFICYSSELSLAPSSQLSVFGSGTGLPRILALRFLKREAHARRGRAARGNNSEWCRVAHRRGSGRNPRASLVPFKWLPNAAALHSEGNLSGVKREVSNGALQPNYKDEDEKPSCNLMYHSNAMAGICFGLPRPPFKISDKEILQQHSFSMFCTLWWGNIEKVHTDSSLPKNCEAITVMIKWTCVRCWEYAMLGEASV